MVVSIRFHQNVLVILSHRWHRCIISRRLLHNWYWNISRNLHYWIAKGSAQILIHRILFERRWVHRGFWSIKIRGISYHWVRGHVWVAWKTCLEIFNESWSGCSLIERIKVCLVIINLINLSFLYFLNF